MIGIEKLKEVATEVAIFAEKVETALADGKLSFIEGLTIAFNAAPTVYGFVKDGAVIRAEYEDLDDNERRELVDHLVVRLDLTSDKAEKLAEAGFNFLVAFDQLLHAALDARKAKEELPE